jgi:serine/threonine protein kinase
MIKLGYLIRCKHKIGSFCVQLSNCQLQKLSSHLILIILFINCSIYSSQLIFNKTCPTMLKRLIGVQKDAKSHAVVPIIKPPANVTSSEGVQPDATKVAKSIQAPLKRKRLLWSKLTKRGDQPTTALNKTNDVHPGVKGDLRLGETMVSDVKTMTGEGVVADGGMKRGLVKKGFKKFVSKSVKKLVKRYREWKLVRRAKTQSKKVVLKEDKSDTQLEEKSVELSSSEKTSGDGCNSTPSWVEGKFEQFVESFRTKQTVDDIDPSMCDTDFKCLTQELALVKVNKLKNGSEGVTYTGRFRGKRRPEGVKTATRFVFVKAMDFTVGRMEIHIGKLLLLKPQFNVVRVFGAFELTDRSYLVMEQTFIGNLDQFIEKQRIARFNEADAYHLFSQMVKGTQHLHNLGYAHCDLNFENFLIYGEMWTEPGRVVLKVADFARCLQCYYSSGRPVMSKEKLRGTPDFAAPETGTGLALPFDATKVDAYSLGVSLFRLIHGYYPFMLVAGNYNDFIQYYYDLCTIKKHMNLILWEDDVSMTLRLLILDLLQFKPENRLLLENVLVTSWCQFHQRIDAFIAELFAIDLD